MKTISTTVTDKDGKIVEVDLIICPNCKTSGFYIYLIGKHQHLQCMWCEDTFCDGTCENAKI